MIDIKATGLVYRNPHPNLKSIQAWFPSVVFYTDDDSNSGELVVSFDLSEAAESLDWRSYIARSNDMGKTWSEPTRIFHEELERPTVHSVKISNMPDGMLVAFGTTFRDDPTQGISNRETLGFSPMEIIMLRSHDRGRSWEGPQTIEPPLVGPSFEICHSIRELADGRWIAPVSTWKDWDGNAPNGMNAYLLVSHDRGQTWPDYVPVMCAYGAGIIHWEQSVVQMSDGRLLAVAWAVEERSGQTLQTPYAISPDGNSFMPSSPTGLHAQTAKILRLVDDKILCVYRRHDQPGLWANLVRLEGDRWINVECTRLWNGANSGMDCKESTSEELSKLKFGYPSMVQLPNGEVFVTFWCLEDCVHNIRWFRLEISN